MSLNGSGDVAVYFTVLVIRGMAEVVLEPSRIQSTACQRLAGRVPQHVDMHRERQPSGFASPLNRAGDAHAAERLTALVDEHVSPGVACDLRRALMPLISSRSR